MKEVDIRIDRIGGCVGQDAHVSDEVNQVQRDHASSGKGKCRELRSNDDRDDVGEQGGANAV